jgi:hypothetical protein
MASIRIPEAAIELLPFCRRHVSRSGDSSITPCFDTYADLLVFTASLGFREMNGTLPTRFTRFADTPYPIDLAIFKNDHRRYPQLLLIALAASGDRNVVRDEEVICKLTEDYAAVGCERLKRRLDRKPGLGHLVIAQRIAEEGESGSGDQI